ncbi:aminoacyl-tRNA deacylase [Candidatus Planktophila dulcis]|uniref:YbaK/EbsC family protein n=1 Tax=Candidatus Planktophila dulcis TaxID=1884914 RepID=UPI000BAC4EB4|nr:YbaK/EbsC family protein [Candidatus Planktophila dulcis]ASY14465.1 aminoacyl-tRNA deacylase [Candidatus Planktophila dulcis]
MDGILEKAAVKRFKEAADSLGVKGEINILADTARTAIDAANGLGIEVGQIASSLIFKLPSGNPLLIITSGRHRVDTDLVAKNLNIAELGRADANYVKEVSGYSVGGVSPIGWISTPEMTLIDEALNDYDVVWAASGHPHAVFPTSYSELIACTGATPMVVGD